MRAWKTHDLCDLFESTRRGFLPCASTQFTNWHLSDDPQVRIKKLDVDWPQHMEPDWDMTTPFEFKIEDGIPIPEIKHGRGASVPAFAAPLGKLEINQSFMVPVGTALELQKLSTKMKTYARNHWPERFFVTRGVKTNDIVEGVRIWRLE